MRINKILIVLLALVMLAGIASALQIESATIGDENQDRIANVTTTFQIKNNATSKITDIQITSNADPKYNVEFSNVPTSLDAGASQTVTITATIPLTHDAVDKNTLEQTALKIGTITATGKIGKKTYSATSDLKMQAVNHLEIRKVKVVCGSKDESLSDGERMKELKPDTKDCTMTVEIKNTFRTSDKDNKKIGDIEFDPATVEVESDNSDIDLDDSDDISSLGARETDELSFDFDIDEEADDGTYNIKVRLTGTDSNGALHGEEWEVKLEVERLKHDIQFKKVTIFPEEIEGCDGNTVKVSATIYNMGRRDEDEAAVELKIPDFKYTKKIDDISLDRDDKTTVNFDVALPANIKEGTYRGTINTYFDSIAESATKTVEFKVKKCGITTEDTEEQTKQTEEKKETTRIIIPQKTTEQKIPPIATQAKSATQKTEKGFTESSAYIGLLIALVVLLLTAITVILVVFFVKKK